MRTTGQVVDELRPLMEAGIVPLVLRGDHSIAVGEELPAHAAVQGPLALVLLDAHAAWGHYYGKRVGEAPAFVSVRAPAGVAAMGFDVVEVSPPYDTAGQTTALLGATVAHELLGLTARRRERS